MDPGNAALAALFAAAGAAAGWIYLAILRRSVASLERGRRGIRRFAALAAARLILFAGGMLGAMWAGLWPLVGYMGGFLALRTVVLARARRAGARKATCGAAEGVEGGVGDGKSD